MEKLTLEKLYKVLNDPKVIAYNSQAYEKVYITNAENYETITKALNIIQEYNTSKSGLHSNNSVEDENVR